MNSLKSILKSNALWALAAACVLLLAWHIAYVCIKNDYILPGIGSTLSAFAALFVDAHFYAALGSTLARTLISFALSFAAGGAFAALAAVCPPFRAAFACVISVVRTLPTMAVTLMLLIWSTPKVAPGIVAALVLVPMVYSQFAAAIEGVDGDLLEMARVYRLTRSQKLKKIILPAVAPEVLAQTGASLSLGLKVMVSAEVLCYTLSSFGGMMQQARLYSEMPRFAALTLCCILIGLALELVSLGIKNAATAWRKGGDGHVRKAHK